jgi:hypothetical protein
LAWQAAGVWHTLHGPLLGELGEAGHGLVRRVDGRHSLLFPIRPVGAKTPLANDSSRDDLEQSPLSELTRVETAVERSLDDGEGPTGRREEEISLRAPDPQRPRDATREKETLGVSLVEPGRCHGPVELAKRARAVIANLHEREDRLESTVICGDQRSIWYRASTSSSFAITPL